MELLWIDDFLALCQTRNFTRAAEIRCTTQSAYSRRIQRLEDWLGSPLVYRESRPVSLTPAGEAFLERAMRLREDILDTRRAVLSVSSHFKKTLRIYTTNTLATAYLPQWLAKQSMENYSLIVASISGCVEAIKRHQADISLIPHFFETTTFDGMSAKEIAQDKLMLVAHTSCRAPLSLSKGRLTGALMAYTPGTTYGACISAMLSTHKIRLSTSPVCESASAEALLAQVKSGLGSAWIPSVLIDSKDIERCPMPAFFDLPYKIIQLTRGA